MLKNEVDEGLENAKKEKADCSRRQNPGLNVVDDGMENIVEFAEDGMEGKEALENGSLDDVGKAFEADIEQDGFECSLKGQDHCWSWSGPKQS